ncbi:hypothetical protein Nepgr_005488 [Nepenthes gracilis]|uniref:ABC-2 type transporter transmembrane domain-containing protein n=1 Tax=Nepenthes gracilis TaxID=150966 RepID=A0AAD3S398_NEPGR|nr:hypothetical protein Nepgr_005488 [Nepenthes gracilis]
MYVTVVFLSFRNSSTVQPVVAAERTILYRERGAGMYSAMPYALAQVMVEIPYIFSQTLLYVIIVYSMTGFEWTTPKFFWFLYFMFFTFMYSTFFGMMWIAMMPNQNLSSVFSSFFYPLWNLFSGFIIPRPAIPIWWRWYYWAFPMAWSFYGLVASQYGDIKDVLEDGFLRVDMSGEKMLRHHGPLEWDTSDWKIIVLHDSCGGGSKNSVKPSSSSQNCICLDFKVTGFIRCGVVWGMLCSSCEVSNS